MTTGLLVNNIGTPEAPTRKAVGAYLSQFLMDPEIISLPAPLRFLLVKGLIVPRRSEVSAKKYRKIWTDDGSPLLAHTERFARAVQDRLGSAWSVKTAMRYGAPSISAALEEFRKEGVDRLILAPMYPQYARSTTASAEIESRRALAKMRWSVPITTLKEFHAQESFLNSQAERIRPFVSLADHVVFSFHGLPESHLRRTPGCLEVNCCAEPDACRKRCYRAQCLQTAQDLADRLGLSYGRWTASFQSRVGLARWIGPATDETLKRLASAGLKNVVVACPSFVADCLETLEEIGLEAKREFEVTGGKMALVPSLNAESDWVDAFSAMVASSRRPAAAE